MYITTRERVFVGLYKLSHGMCVLSTFASWLVHNRAITTPGVGLCICIWFMGDVICMYVYLYTYMFIVRRQTNYTICIVFMGRR